jgi:cytochrome c2
MKCHAACSALFSLALLLCSDMAADNNTGQDLFARRCSGCHALDNDKEGPRLRGVFGRKAGTVTDFPYSEALRKSDIVWDEPALKRWLETLRKWCLTTIWSFTLRPRTNARPLSRT